MSSVRRNGNEKRLGRDVRGTCLGSDGGDRRLEDIGELTERLEGVVVCI